VTGQGPWPVLISGQTQRALRTLAMEHVNRLKTADAAELAAISYTSAMRRTHHAYRIAVQGTSGQQMADDLRRRIEEPTNEDTSNAPRLDEKLARWKAGTAVDWQDVFPEHGSVVDLPLYPFEGRAYWLEETRIGGAEARPSTTAPAAPSSAAGALPRDWFYSVDWAEKESEASQIGFGNRPATWLLLGAGSELNSKLADAIRLRGDVVVTPRLYGLTSAASLSDFLAELPKVKTPYRYTVYVAGEQDAATLTMEALHVTQELLKRGLPTRLWFLTQGAEPVGGLSKTEHASLRGFSRVFGLEHPEMAGGVIDVDPVSVAAVCDQIEGSCCDDRILLRAGRRSVARLRRDPIEESAALKLRADRSYLVTGAFGRVGKEIAEWLVAAGARHLFLVGRRAPQQMEDPEILERLAERRAHGIHIQAQACDVADEACVRKLLATMDDRGAPLAGVIHAAAATRFCPLEQASSEDVRSIFRAKLEGAQVLDRCTRTRNLDFFVLFSSAAATIGLRNGIVYAAANSALEAIAAGRQALGLPGLCVEWGSWASPQASAQQALVEQSGFAPMNPKLALQALAALMTARRTAGIVANIDWRVLGPALEMRGRQALVAELTSEAEQQPKLEDKSAASDMLHALRGVSTAERRSRLLDFVAAEVRQVFGMAPDETLDESRGLFAMGMDSLMSVRLKRRLETGMGLRLPGTLTLTYPSITALAEYLEAAIFGQRVSGTSRPAWTSVI
jgi:acyl transferase domain-containing protein/acyl carrier protein